MIWIVLSIIVEINASGSDNCGFETCTNYDPTKLNIHVVPHSHNDVGWHKTFDQYFYGTNSKVERAGVQSILDSVFQELWDHSKRRFVYADIAFFWKWWNHQPNHIQKKVRALVRQGRLQFVGGAWSQNDEATTHYQSIIDQFTYGLSKLKEVFGPCGRPHVGWQIASFGHSREFASLLATMGYDALFLGRIDYQDRATRLKRERRLEFIWRGDDILGKSSDIFTNILYNSYIAPVGFCFDIMCSDEPIVDDKYSPNYNVDQKTSAFLNYTLQQAKHYRTNNVMIPMGGDFYYQDADTWYNNLDKLIEHSNHRIKRKKLNMTVYYSTPNCYLKAVHQANKTIPIKQDDFFPYANESKTYWSGYYSSRPNIKYIEREANRYLQAVKLLHVMLGSPEENMTQIEDLKNALGLMQDHHVISGTVKQFVADDFERSLHKAVDGVVPILSHAFNKYIQANESHRTRKTKFQFNRCLFNESSCNISEISAQFVVAVYNHLAWKITEYIRIPIIWGEYEVYSRHRGRPILIKHDMISIPESVLRLPSRKSIAKYEIVFPAELDPVSIKSFYIRSKADIGNKTKRKKKRRFNGSINEKDKTNNNNNNKRRKKRVKRFVKNDNEEKENPYSNIRKNTLRYKREDLIDDTKDFNNSSDFQTSIENVLKNIKDKKQGLNLRLLFKKKRKKGNTQGKGKRKRVTIRDNQIWTEPIMEEELKGYLTRAKIIKSPSEISSIRVEPEILHMNYLNAEKVSKEDSQEVDEFAEVLKNRDSNPIDSIQYDLRGEKSEEHLQKRMRFYPKKKNKYVPPISEEFERNKIDEESKPSRKRQEGFINSPSNKGRKYKPIGGDRGYRERKKFEEDKNSPEEESYERQAQDKFLLEEIENEHQNMANNSLENDFSIEQEHESFDKKYEGINSLETENYEKVTSKTEYDNQVEKTTDNDNFGSNINNVKKENQLEIKKDTTASKEGVESRSKRNKKFAKKVNKKVSFESRETNKKSMESVKSSQEAIKNSQMNKAKIEALKNEKIESKSDSEDEKIKNSDLHQTIGTEKYNIENEETTTLTNPDTDHNIINEQDTNNIKKQDAIDYQNADEKNIKDDAVPTNKLTKENSAIEEDLDIGHADLKQVKKKLKRRRRLRKLRKRKKKPLKILRATDNEDGVVVIGGNETTTEGTETETETTTSGNETTTEPEAKEIKNEYFTISTNTAMEIVKIVLIQDRHSEVEFTPQFSYYTSSAQTSNVHSSTNAIFGFDANHTISNRFSDTAGGDYVQELRIYSNKNAEHIVRLYKGLSFIEVDWTVGPLDVNDDITKEYVIKYKTNLENEKEFYTDSNGRQVLKRIRNKRPEWDVEIEKDVTVPANYYPITNQIFIKDSEHKFTVLTDRSQGGSSIEDGDIELMLHRTLANNLDLDGKDLAIRGKHRLLLSSSKDNIHRIEEKKQILQFHNQPLVLVADSPHISLEQWLSYRISSYHFAYSLPDGLHLLSVEPFVSEGIRKGVKSFLLRIENYLEPSDTDDATIKFDLLLLFSTIRIIYIDEPMLGANVPVEDYKKMLFRTEHRFFESFNDEYGNDISAQKVDDYSPDTPYSAKQQEYKPPKKIPFDGYTAVCTFKPKQIRTFVVGYSNYRVPDCLNCPDMTVPPHPTTRAPV